MFTPDLSEWIMNPNVCAFPPSFFSSAFILMEALECEGSVLLERASFTLLFFFASAVSEADHLAGPVLNFSIAQTMPFDSPDLSGRHKQPC